MTSVAVVQRAGNVVTIRLDATELPENKLVCDIDCEPDLRTSSGETYTKELVRVLCGSGLAFARRRLAVANGLQISVVEVSGTLDRSDEVGVCHATGLAIAKALKKDDSPIITSMSGWIVADD